MFSNIFLLAQTAKAEHASWAEPFIIGLVVGMAVILLGRKLYRKS
jgi:hypothetical protein